MSLLIAGAWHPAKEHFLELENLGHRIVFLQNESDVLPCAPEWVEGIVCNALFLFHEIGQFVNLQYIQLTSAGFDRVPMSYVQPHHIEIHNAHGVYSIPMAESALCGVLQLYRHSRFFAENQKSGIGKSIALYRRYTAKQYVLSVAEMSETNAQGDSSASVAMLSV